MQVRKAHIVGSGVGSLGAAVYLIQDTEIEPSDITIYEAGLDPGGAMAASWVWENRLGRQRRAYVLPATRIMEREYRCSYELFSHFPSVSDANQTLDEDVHEFNWRYPYHDTTRILDERHEPRSSRRFGVRVADTLKLAWLAARRECTLDDKTIEDWGRWRFSEDFYKSEFWVAWSTMMGPLKEHSVIEMRRYLWRFLHIIPDIADMTTIWRMRMNQNDSVARPICDWLTAQGVNFELNAFVEDVSFKQVQGGLAASEIFVRGRSQPIHIKHDQGDVVLMTLGSQVADMTVGRWKTAPAAVSPHPGQSWALWAKIAQRHPEFGRPEKFFGGQTEEYSKWVTCTITTYGPTLLDCLSTITGVDPARAGLVTLDASPWKITIAPCPKPHFLDQPDDVAVVWGYSILPGEPGKYVAKKMWECTGEEILTETVRQLGFERRLSQILAECECIPCYLPHANSVWMKRNAKDRPEVRPANAKNFAFIGQFCEMPKDTMFTMEYSVRSAREAVSSLCELTVRPTPVYQAWKDPQALLGAAKAFLL
jgi:oleate hydratase